MKDRETVLARKGIDAIKIRDGEFRSYLMIGQPCHDAAQSFRITPSSARRIAEKLIRWADAKGAANA